MNKFGLIASVCLAASGCATAKQVDSKAVAYGVELLQCVEQAKNKAESAACRAKVNEKYGQCDAGVCP